MNQKEWLKKPLIVELFYDDDEVSSWCADCGDEIPIGSPVCWEPMTEVAPRAIDTVHPWCACKNGYSIQYPENL